MALLHGNPSTCIGNVKGSMTPQGIKGKHNINVCLKWQDLATVQAGQDLYGLKYVATATSNQ